MSEQRDTDKAAAAPEPQELREEVERTRHELGRTVEALAAKADVKGRAQEKAVRVKEQATGKAAELKDQVATKAGEVATKAGEAAHVVQDKLPELPQPVRDKAAQGAVVARNNRGVLFAVAGGVAALLLLRRWRRS
ncbi:DUF3618 domain-containing protein [Streptomyces sp. NPDC001941]|uniref:DUF3618 domain-containing protein n=1 Tax=Streptomyces sp. NPDC001941 TaxID=3154659 RepID=UPI00331F9B2E